LTTDIFVDFFISFAKQVSNGKKQDGESRLFLGDTPKNIIYHEKKVSIIHNAALALTGNLL
jgi:hypothetical protein